MPSGTMVNQVALRVLTRPGDTVLVSRESHVVWSEMGGGGVNAGVQFTEIGSRGVFTAGDVRAARVPRGHIITPPTTLVEIENTHNRSGGVVFPPAEAERVCAVARELGMATYLDGARLWNAVVASAMPAASLAAPFDLVSVAFSKGLGAPGGSVMAGSRELIVEATRHRRIFGGAMRQTGIYAAAALFSIDHHLEQLATDHGNAAALAKRLAASPRIALDLATVQTNIVVFKLGDGAPDAATTVSRAKEKGVLLFAFGPRTMRAVTHLDVTREQCEQAGDVLAGIAES